jgi:dTDP-4-dehydrorhamnose reductase
MSKIYIAGCGGMLGEAFHQQFSSTHELKCTDIDDNEPWLSPLDFRDLGAYRKDIEAFKPDALFHLGAHTSLEYCEEHADDAYATNTMAVENAVFIANRLEIPLLYISTAGIFDGAASLYDDWAQPNPLGVYARSKYAGERYVVEHAHRYLVCRAGWMMGGGPRKDKKFIQKLMKQLKAGKTTLQVVDDKDGTPTYTHDFARNVRVLLEAEVWGLYNMVCGGQTSRFEVAQELVRQLGLQERVTIEPVHSDFFNAEYFAPRPPSERLVNKKLDLRQMNVMQDWRVALQQYLAAYYEGYLSK